MVSKVNESNERGTPGKSDQGSLLGQSRSTGGTKSQSGRSSPRPGSQQQMKNGSSAMKLRHETGAHSKADEVISDVWVIDKSGDGKGRALGDSIRSRRQSRGRGSRTPSRGRANSSGRRSRSPTKSRRSVSPQRRTPSYTQQRDFTDEPRVQPTVEALPVQKSPYNPKLGKSFEADQDTEVHLSDLERTRTGPCTAQEQYEIENAYESSENKYRNPGRSSFNYPLETAGTPAESRTFPFWFSSKNKVLAKQSTSICVDTAKEILSNRTSIRVFEPRSKKTLDAISSASRPDSTIPSPKSSHSSTKRRSRQPQGSLKPRQELTKISKHDLQHWLEFARAQIKAAGEYQGAHCDDSTISTVETNVPGNDGKPKNTEVVKPHFEVADETEPSVGFFSFCGQLPCGIGGTSKPVADMDNNPASTVPETLASGGFESLAWTYPDGRSKD